MKSHLKQPRLARIAFSLPGKPHGDKARKIAILGFGREGQSAFNFIQHRPEFKGATITICDQNQRISRLKQKNISYQLGRGYLKNLSQFDLIIRSPGIPYLALEIQRAIKKGGEVTGGTQIFFEELFRYRAAHPKRTHTLPFALCPLPVVIGVTGTKGKGTVTTLLAQILKATGERVFLAGNIGKPMLDNLPAAIKSDFIILELSSFQLQDLKYSPDVAVVLDISPDHLDAHKDFKEYLGAKMAIAKYQKKENLIFAFTGNKFSRQIVHQSKARKILISADQLSYFQPAELKIFGPHNLKNAIMAASVAKLVGAPDHVIRGVIINFDSLPHRLEFVREVMPVENAPIRFYNDSASTNPQTVSAAALSFTDPSVLICGGKDKNLDYIPLRLALKKSSVRAVVLFGENQKKIATVVAEARIPYFFARNLNLALARSAEIGEQLAWRYRKPVAVIFSPGAASFDMFRDYADRGEQFKKAVLRLPVS